MDVSNNFSSSRLKKTVKKTRKIPAERLTNQENGATGGAFVIGPGTIDFNWLHRPFSPLMVLWKKNDQNCLFTMYARYVIWDKLQFKPKLYRVIQVTSQ